jgi:hypothetical protein
MTECSNYSLRIRCTQRFGALEVTNDQEDADALKRECVGVSSLPNSEFPVIGLYDILIAHGSIKRRQSLQNNKRMTPNSEKCVAGISSSTVRQQLYDALVHHGFVLISVPNGRAANVIRDMRSSLGVDLFPTVDGTRSTHLETSPTTYVSERGIPMYKLGYEACEDGVREVFRVAAGDPDTVIWPPIHRSTTSNTHIMNQNERACTKSVWMLGLGFLRHVTDAALDLLFQCKDAKVAVSSAPKHRRQNRPNSGAATWWNPVKRNEPFLVRAHEVRSGDFSVLYAMHYFNDDVGGTDEPGIAVKAHVDPSLLVVEPFLCTTTAGLQIWDRTSKDDSSGWMDCDGPNSPLHALVQKALCRDEEMMLLFSGKALSEYLPSIEPTLHRVVNGTQPRCTIIYEQKYAEFYPPPSFD